MDYVRIENLWKVKDAAQFLRLSPKTVYRYAETRRIPFARLPTGALRFVPEDLLAWAKREK